MQNITVIGTGYVGLVSGTCLANIGHQVTCCDIDQAKIDVLRSGHALIYEPGLKVLMVRNMEAGRLSFSTDIGAAVAQAEVVVIAVGTPMSPTGEADLQYVEQAVRDLAAHVHSYKVIATKSTVPVGTGKRIQELILQHMPDPSVPFDVVSNPEFLREGSAVQDTMRMERAIIGVSSEKAAAIMTEIHAPFQTQVLIMNVESAELCKYAANAFLATKISYVNDVAQLCERVGADVDLVTKGMGLDSRIGSKYLQAGIGYGGSCFPKDTEALLHMAGMHGLDFDIVRAVMATNVRQQDLVVEKLMGVLPGLEGKTVAVLGLTFKPNTDDMRYASSLRVIPSLLAEGAGEVRVYDPVGMDEAKRLLPVGVTFCMDAYEAVGGADACLLLTEWDELVALDWERVKGLMARAILVDGRNCFDVDAMAGAGWTYLSVGRRAVIQLKGKFEGDL